MTKIDVLELLREMIWVVIKISAPVLITALVVGTLISLIQALTQIQEATLSFIPKALAIGIVLLLFFPFMLENLQMLSDKLFDKIINLT